MVTLFHTCDTLTPVLRNTGDVANILPQQFPGLRQKFEVPGDSGTDVVGVTCWSRTEKVISGGDSFYRISDSRWSYYR